MPGAPQQPKGVLQLLKDLWEDKDGTLFDDWKADPHEVAARYSVTDPKTVEKILDGRKGPIQNLIDKELGPGDKPKLRYHPCGQVCV